MSLKMTAQDDEAMAAADKEMEERANRVKHLLSLRYQGLKNDQVRFRQMLNLWHSEHSLGLHVNLFHGILKGGKTSA